jgi:hypothetical protein
MLAGGGRTNLNLNVGIHYHRSDSAQHNPFPTIAGDTRQSGWDVPVSLGFPWLGLTHNLRVDFNRSRSDTTNLFASTRDVAGEAGILGVATDPFDWGVPNLSFTSASSLRDVNPNFRHDQTITVADSIVKTRGHHTVRFGGDLRDARLDSRSDTSARGSYVFTGIYTGAGTPVPGGDFADFLLGLAQQASVQYGPGLARFRARAWNLYLQDDWRVGAKLTLNAGVRYEYQAPYREADNRLVTLDVTPGFTAASPVMAGQVGPFTGALASTIVRPDRNNVAPRLGVAWRATTKTVVHGGYAINYASVPYLSIAQRLAGQPPFAVTDTTIGTPAAPLTLAGAFAAPAAATTTNNFGVDPAYALGYVQIWNVDIQHDFGRTLSVAVAYTGTRGSRLDLQRAPNRGPSGLRIPGVQSFIWESSGGRSIMHALSVRVTRRLAQGVSGGATYTLSKSMDDASTIGGGAVVVAQNDQDLAAEWGLSSFDQRHRFSASVSVELPFGPGRRWLNGNAVTGKILGGWTWNATLSAATGTPFTVRLIGDVTDVARGTNGTLRADYTGAPIVLADPTIARFFNIGAFAAPAPGTFGNAVRNSIVGPGNQVLNMSLMRTVTLAGLRGFSVRIQASNVLNTPQWAAIDTVFNSLTFGQVTAVRPMRSVQVIARLMF